MIGAPRSTGNEDAGVSATADPSLFARLRTGAGLLKIEFRRSGGLLIFPVLVAVGWWLSGDVMYGKAYIWLDTSAGVRYTTFFMGPLVASVSAWMAGRNHRRGMTEMLSTTPRSHVVRDLGVWAGTALWGISAYGLLTVVLGTLTWWNATWGAPVPGYFLVGLLAMVANSAIGYAAGYSLPSRFTAPLIAGGLFFLQLAPGATVDWEPRLQLLSPAPNSLIYREVFHEIPPVVAQQSLWFAGLAGVALATVALKTTRGSLLAWVAFLGFLTAATVGFFTSVEASERYEHALGPGGEIEPFEYVCREGRIEVCVHPAYERLLPETAKAVNEIADPLVGIRGVPNRALQVSEYAAPGVAGGGNAIALNTIWMEEGTSNPFFKYEVALGLVQDQAALEGDDGVETMEPTAEDLERCVRAEDREFLDPALEAQEVVSGWLLKQTGSYTVPGY